MLELMKRNLLSNDPQLQSDTIRHIHQQLMNASTSSHRLNFVDGLIRLDIAFILCDFLAVNDGEILRLTLSCLRIISESELFYTYNVAMQAICQILQNAYLICQRSTEERKVLRMMAITLTVFVSRADSFAMNLNTISKIDQLLEFINNLNVQNTIDPTLVLVVSNLYAVVLPHVECFGEKNISTMIERIHQSLMTAIKKGIWKYIGTNDPIVKPIIKAVVVICNAGMKLCENHDRSPSASPEFPPIVNEVECVSSKLMIDIICEALMEIVIPNIIPVEDEKNDVVPFADCLCQLYNRADVDMNEISKQLLIQGYLKYLYSVIKSRESNRELICECIASILADLTRSSLMADKWSDGPQGFRRFIKDGLLTYSNSIAVNVTAAASDAFLFLCFFHCLATRDFEVINIVKAMPLALRIKHFSTDNTLEIPTFQVTWFLLAMTALEYPSTVDCIDFAHAVIRIVEVIEKIGIESCYTHHPALPCFVLQNSVFPEKMRNSVVKMWLTYEDNVRQLVSPGRMQILVDSLLDIIRTGTEELVERASSELLRIMKNSGNSTSCLEQQITTMMWEKLPEVLNDFSMNHERSICGYFKMLNRSSSSSVSILLAIRSSNNLISLWNRDDLTITSDVQMLLVKQMSKMLSVAFIAKDARVVSLFTNDYKILDKLRAEAFSKEHDNLSASCYECLANILHGQKRFGMKCQKPIALHPIDLFKALLRKPHVCFGVLTFLDEIWVDGMEHSAVPCPKFTDKEARKILTGIYRTYIRIHLNTPPTKWAFTFCCLTNLLKFCRNNYDFILFDCCDYVCNHSVINLTISCGYSDESLITFLKTWLRLALYSQCSFVVHAFESKRLRDNKLGDQILFESTFDEAIRELSVYIEKLIVAGRLQADSVEELKSMLAKFI